MDVKSACKFFFPGEFNKFIKKVEVAFDESSMRDKKVMFLELNKDFEELKKKKRESCKNSSDVEKKIDVLSLLLLVLEYELTIDDSNMVKIYHELDAVEKEVDKLNISVNTVNKGEALLRKKIKQIYEKIKFATDVNIYRKNRVNNAKRETNENRKHRNVQNNLTKRLKKLKLALSGGRKTRRR
jgi:hypothetical protein